MAQALIIWCALMLAGETAPALHSYKGNLHTHTNASDGDAPPDDVARWYQQHGYDFLVLTDHNKLSTATAPGLLLIPGEEVTDRLAKKPLHVNAIGIRQLVNPKGGTSVVDVLQHDIDAVREAGGIALINHPNFGWAINADELKLTRGATLLEIASGHPTVNFLGGGGTPSAERMWDEMLTAGQMIYAVAVDDAHDYKNEGEDRRPGRAWVVVQAPSLTPENIIAALKRGSFYASTGVEIAGYEPSRSAINVAVASKGDARFTTLFIGNGGRILAVSTLNPATYAPRGDERYIRVRVTDSNGRSAWLQPFFP